MQQWLIIYNYHFILQVDIEQIRLSGYHEEKKRWWQELNPVRQSQETLNRPVHKIIIQEAKQEFTRVYN